MIETFNKRMFNGINSEGYYPIRRSFGQTLQNCDMDALLAYTKLSDNKNKIEQNIEFLIAGLCYNINKPNQIRDKYINFEDILKRLADSDPKNENRSKEIEDFLKLKYDNNGYFSRRFYILSKKLIPFLHNDEQINYTQLFKDLKYWNFNNNTQMKWAMAIVKFDEEIDKQEGNI